MREQHNYHWPRKEKKKDKFVLVPKNELNTTHS
jgi:hypothetical protein